MSKEKKSKEKSDLIKNVNEAEDQIKKFIYILFGVALVCVCMYFVTAKFLVKKNDNNTKNNADITISYSNVNVGNIFNRPYDNYYVLATDPNNSESSFYTNLAGAYANDAKHKKIYNLDLSLKVNKNYVGKSNRKATKADEIKLSDPTLIEIKNGKIVNY